MTILTIEDNELRAYDNPRDDNAFSVVRTEADLLALFVHDDVSCSSTIDFAREETSDPTVLALVDRMLSGIVLEPMPVEEEEEPKVECPCCSALVAREELMTLRSASQTHWSPAEYEDGCIKCIPAKYRDDRDDGER